MVAGREDVCAGAPGGRGAAGQLPGPRESRPAVVHSTGPVLRSWCSILSIARFSSRYMDVSSLLLVFCWLLAY